MSQFSTSKIVNQLDTGDNTKDKGMKDFSHTQHT